MASAVPPHFGTEMVRVEAVWDMNYLVLEPTQVVKLRKDKKNNVRK